MENDDLKEMKFVSPVKLKFYHFIVLPFCLAVFCLGGSGCATVNSDAVINNFKQAQSYPPVILTENTKASLKSLAGRANMESTLNFGMGADDVQPQILLDGIRQILSKRFQQLPGEQNSSFVLVFDAQAKLGMVTGSTTSLELTGTFKEDDKTIDIIQGEGSSKIPFPAVNFAFHKAADSAFVQFDENLKNSQKITAYITMGAFVKFKEKVRKWQALSPKPPLPEEARRFRVLADDAVANKEFEKAANYYEQGLVIDSMWPAGQYNAAMIYNELHIYYLAAMHMKRYLALKPEDAKKYQDQIYIWEEKVKETNE